ncbi:MAG: type IV pili methyl-accepting chemotaxis transducer N-terminal domain-containing protein [Anaerolineales bacterium]|jgi:two-component system nitrate/nitrite sensor histidine kinase NarX
MKIKSIQGRLILLFIFFVLLVTISAGATIWSLNAQRTDAVVINLAGRQRMLIQQMTRLVQEIKSNDRTLLVTELSNSISKFDKTLAALKDGGQAPYLQDQSVDIPPTKSIEIQTQIDLVSETWSDFQTNLTTIIQEEPSSIKFTSAAEEVENISPHFLELMDLTVRLFERESTAKLIRVRGMQVGFIISAFLLLILGGWVTKSSILNPLQILAKNTKQIGDGDLNTPININNPKEINDLANTLDTMRMQLKTSHMELVSWTETLEMRVEQRTREVDTLYEVSKDISSRLDLNHLLDSITEKTRELLDCETATLCMLTDDGNTLSIQAHSGPRAAISGKETNSQIGLGKQILSGKEAIMCSRGECSGFCNILKPSYRNSHLAAPLWVEDRVIGALCVGNSNREAFPPENEQLLTKLANSAAIAIENARLYAKAEKVAALEERQRIAAEIHDGLAQTLSYLGLSIDQVEDLLQNNEQKSAFEKLEKIRTTINQTTDKVRTSIADLLDKTPTQLSLQNCLGSLVSEYSSQHNLVIDWRDQIETEIFLPRSNSEQILQIAKEALLNSHNHANANNIHLILKIIGGDYYLIVRDDGIGFDPSHHATDNKDHFGLQVMQARANRLGGQLQVNSRLGKGTQIILSWSKDRSPIINADD